MAAEAAIHGLWGPSPAVACFPWGDGFWAEVFAAPGHGPGGAGAFGQGQCPEVEEPPALPPVPVEPRPKRPRERESGEPDAFVAPRFRAAGVLAGCVKRRRRTYLGPLEQEQAERRAALAKWAAILDETSEEACLVSQLAQVKAEDWCESFADALRSRETPTLDRRAGALLMFLRWARPLYAAYGVAAALPPPPRRHGLRRAVRASPGARAGDEGQSLLEAFGLAGAVLGFDSGPVCASARVNGGGRRDAAAQARRRASAAALGPDHACLRRGCRAGRCRGRLGFL